MQISRTREARALKQEAGLRSRKRKGFSKRERTLYLMLLLPVLLVLVFSYGSMAGVIMAFQDFVPGKGLYEIGSEFVGWENFRQLFAISSMGQVIFNTLYISVLKIVSSLVFSVIFAILLNEIRFSALKKAIQTAIFLPYFLSWVIVSGMLIDLLSPDTGAISQVVQAFGIEPPLFLADNNAFPWVLVISNLWKDSGYGVIVYLAAITNIDPSLYEAASIDGAGHFKRAWHITVPAIMPVVMLVGLLSLGSILSAGFEQVFNLYSPTVYESGDIIDTLVYRLGVSDGQYSLSTAVGLFKSVVSFILMTAGYYAAYKIWDYRIF